MSAMRTVTWLEGTGGSVLPYMSWISREGDLTRVCTIRRYPVRPEGFELYVGTHYIGAFKSLESAQAAGVLLSEEML